MDVSVEMWWILGRLMMSVVLGVMSGCSCVSNLVGCWRCFSMLV